MLRREIRCQESHTELCPGKLGARLWWLTRVTLCQDIITISQATLKALWEDTHGVGSGVAKRKTDSGRATYPNMALHFPGGDIRETVQDYCANKYGGRCKEVILDVDLTGTARECWPIILDIMGTCKQAKQKARVLLTFRNGRDSFKSLDQRIAWMRDNLPHGAVYNGHHAYTSGRIRHDASRTTGSAMCVAEFLV